MRPYLKKPFTKIGLVEWLKVKALSSSPSTEKNFFQVLDQINLGSNSDHGKLFNLSNSQVFKIRVFVRITVYIKHLSQCLDGTSTQ
jgi:hypothetical protein